MPLQQGTWALPQGERFDAGRAQVIGQIDRAGGEITKGRLTLAELDDEEQSLERLRRWYRAIRGRNLFGAPGATAAEQRLKDVAEALERFADQAYQAREAGGSG